MDLSFGNSKIARRFALLFIACAFVPTLALIFYSYERVGQQMIDQSVDKLVKETKTYGLSLFDRLVRISDQIQYIEQSLKVNEEGNIAFVDISHIESLELFEGISIISEDGILIHLMGDPDILEVDVLRDRSQADIDSIFVYSREIVDGPADIFLFKPLYLPELGRVFLVGMLNVPYLWGIGTVPLLPPATELAVYDKYGKILVSTYASPGDDLAEINVKNPGKNLWDFEYRHNGEKYFAGLWTLFLKSRFDAGSWTIILSQPEEYILSAIKDFRSNLIRVITLGLLVILLVSLSLIRRRLAPLDKLKIRTAQIAQKDFTSELEIKSGDEFEDLADSFNTMSYQLHRQFTALETIERIDRTILSSLKLNEIIGATLPLIRDFFSAEIIIFGHLLDSESMYVKCHILQLAAANPNSQYVQLKTSDYDRLFSRRIPINWIDEHFCLDNIVGFSKEKYRSYFTVPLKKDQDDKGFLLLAFRVKREWKDNEQSQFSQLANQLSIAIANSELIENLEKLASGTIDALARTVDAKSKWTSGHSERVAALAGRIGEAMHLPVKQVDLLKRAGLLHDIGKIGIPRFILDKPDKLSDAEYEEIKNHPEIGAKILEPIEVYQDIIPAVIQHHERYDGKGYPRRIAGKDIDINARILAVADVYDALSSSRPYRDGWVNEKVTAFMDENSGKMFDSEIIDAFKVAIKIS